MTVQSNEFAGPSPLVTGAASAMGAAAARWLDERRMWQLVLADCAGTGEMTGQIGFLLSPAVWNITGKLLVSDWGYSL